MAEFHLSDYKKRWEDLMDLGIELLSDETLGSLKKKIKKKKDEKYEIQYEYITLVFPPGSNPPTRNSI